MAMIKLILIPLMLACILLQRATNLFLRILNQLISLRPTITHVDVRECGLLSLPTEVLYEIVKELEYRPPEATQSSGSQRPVLAFSQVCRRLRRICYQSLFKEPPPLTPSHLASRFEGLTTTSRIGVHVHKLSISLTTLDSEQESTLSSILDYLVNLTDLTVIYRKAEVHRYSKLIRACCRRASLKGLHVKEAGLDMTVTPADPGESAVGCYFVDHLVKAILMVDGQRLETFVHIASLPLHASTFTALRTRAHHLQTIVFRTSIQSNLRMLFNQPTQWASAGKLKELVIRTCGGVHHGKIAVHVANGVFGQLQKLGIIRCGYGDDALFEAVNEPPVWAIGVLKRLDIDHADDREVKALSIIHVQEIYATRVFTTGLIDALNSGGWPGLQRVYTYSQGNGSGSQILQLKQACDARGISLLTGAVPYGNCSCHNE